MANNIIFFNSSLAFTKNNNKYFKYIKLPQEIQVYGPTPKQKSFEGYVEGDPVTTP